MKRILGLDLGTTSIGWALIDEPENKVESTEIVKTGVRVVPLSVDEEQNFEKGKSITTNAERTLKRGARRSLQRYKLRRKLLREILIEHDILKATDSIAEDGKNTTHQLLSIRSRAVAERVELHDFARVLFAINKKRGYKSNRKAVDDGDGVSIEGMEAAKVLHNRQITPGMYALELLEKGKKKLPDFYPSDLENEFELIWKVQASDHPELLSASLLNRCRDLSGNQLKALFLNEMNLDTSEVKGTKEEKRLALYQLRKEATETTLTAENVALVLCMIRNEISGASGYLGKISDRSKELILNKQTIGQYLYDQIKRKPHTRLKGQVFYRQDYQDEFDRIWDCQSRHHLQLTPELKKEIADLIIFYQRPLKSQKGLVAICELERFDKEVVKNGKKALMAVGPRVAPKSSPIFQECKVWQLLNALQFRNLETRQKVEIHELDEDMSIRRELYDLACIKEKLTARDILGTTFTDPKEWELNYKDGIPGNLTSFRFLKEFTKVVELAGYELDKGKQPQELIHEIKEILESIGIDPKVVELHAVAESDKPIHHPAYRLWHLLYSYEGDDSKSGVEGLKQILQNKYGFSTEASVRLSRMSFSSDYGNLSTKAMLKMLPFLKSGMNYSDAAANAGYNHSHSVTKEENEKRDLKDALELLPKNSLRNPVVEKILNQLVNVVNVIMHEYGRPDEIRIELARELKSSSKEREAATKGIAANTRRNEEIKKEIESMPPFNQGVRVTRKDIIKFKLWQELNKIGHKSIYTGQHIPKELIFSKDIDVEHIIPQARLFDDSFSNKTLEYRDINLEKGNDTAVTYLKNKYGEDSNEFKAFLDRVEKLKKSNTLSPAKVNKLLTPNDKIRDGFIERDLRNTQYISRKAQQMLLGVCRSVVPTTGKITSELRAQWGLVDVLKELNLPKYTELGLVHTEKTKDGRSVLVIEGWSKRNDHRHHAMDALTVAFCKRAFVQYFNYLNARKDEGHKNHGNIIAIEKKYCERNEKGRLIFKPPIEGSELRKSVRMHLENTLVSFKAKNKVVTRNKNRIKTKKGELEKTQLTPRGQLHKETVYGRSKKQVHKLVKVGAGLSREVAAQIVDDQVRKAVNERLAEFEYDPKKAFSGKNSISKRPIQLPDGSCVEERVQITELVPQFTIRKDVNPDNFKTAKNIEKVVDQKVRSILMERLKTSGGDAKKAFTDLDKNPIWLNEEKGIAVKRVTITGVSNAEPLHQKKDHFGKILLDKNGKPIPSDYVSTGNNHHVAIYRDAKGKLQEKVVSFYEAVALRDMGLPVIDKKYNSQLGWEFLFSMKQNEMFVFPNDKTGFDPASIDLFNPINYEKVSPNLFRVQKFTMKDYFFRHHLETSVENTRETLNTCWKRIGPIGLERVVKVRINHLGKIVHVGEY